MDKSLSEFLKNLVEAVIMADKHGVVTFMNPAAEEITGWKLNEAYQKQLPEIFKTINQTGGITWSSVAQAIWDAALLVTRDGSHIAIDYSASMLRDDKKEHDGYLLVFRDVTLRLRAEEALRRSRRKYKDLVNSIDGIVWEADAATLQFTFVSKQAERILGFPIRQWVQEREFWKCRLHPEDRERIIAFFKVIKTISKPHLLEHRMIHAGGNVLWMRNTVAAVSENDHPVKLRGVMTDITEQKKTEEQLRWLEKAVETMQLGVTITDIKRNILYLNQAEATMHGYSVRELIGENVKIFVPPEFRNPLTWKQIKELKRNRRESLNRRKDGTIFPVQLISDLITDASGGPLGVVTTCEDITEQKKAQEALRRAHDDLEIRVRERTAELAIANKALSAEILEHQNTEVELRQSENRLKRLAEQRKRLLEASQSMLATLELDRVVKRILLTLREVLIYDMCGFYWLDEEKGLLRPSIVYGGEWISEKLNEWSIPLGKGISGAVALTGVGEVVNNAHRDPRAYYPEDAHVKFEHRMCVPIRAKGKTIGVFNVSRKSDPSFSEEEFELVYLFIAYAATAIENARLFEQTKASEEKYRRLFEESQDAVFISSPDRKFIDINPAGLQLFGYSSKEEIQQIDIGRELYFDPADRENYQNILEQNGAVKDYELNLKTKNGKKLVVLVTANAVRDDNGVLIAYRGIIRDITERKLAEEKEKLLQEKLRKSEAMEKMGRLVSGVAHEVRNPLTGIQAVAEVLDRELKHDTKFQPFLEGIRIQVNRLSQLMRDLLELGKPVDESRIRMESILQVCSSAVDVWNQTVPNRTHRVRVEKPEGDLRVRMDSTRIQQVFVNLLDNAAQHSPPDSEILVEIQEAGASVAVRVIDEGSGIHGEALSRLFEPFFTTRRKGTGLGLSLVKHYVETHGGTVTACNNAPNPGCTFEVILPLAT